MPNQLQPISQKQFLVTLNEDTGLALKVLFTEATGISVEKEEEEYNDGETGVTKTHYGFEKFSRVTLRKAYDPRADQDALLTAWMRETFKGNKRFSVSIQAVEADRAGTVIQGSKTIILTRCQLAKFNYPDVNRMGSGIAMLSMEIMPEDITEN